MCSALARGSRLNVWKTNPMASFRTRANSSSVSSLTSWPLSQYLPAVGVSRQPIMFMNVDLPLPDGPITATNSPCRISRSTPRTACTVSAPRT